MRVQEKVQINSWFLLQQSIIKQISEAVKVYVMDYSGVNLNNLFQNTWNYDLNLDTSDINCGNFLHNTYSITLGFVSSGI